MSDTPNEHVAETKENGLIEFGKQTAKATGGALAVTVGILATILTGNETLADVTFVQWLVIIAAILATWGFVYRIPNKPIL